MLRPDPLPASLPARDKVIALLLLVFALGLYAAVVVGLQPVIGQFPKYPFAALRFLHGGMDVERVLDYSPVYLGLCVLITRYLASAFQSLLWLQISLTALTAAGIFLVLRRHFGRGVSVSGALAFLLNTGVMVYVGVFEPEPAMMAALVLLVLFAASRTPAGSLIAGVILTVGLFTRPTVLAYVFAVPLHLWLNLRGRSRREAIAWFLVPVLIGIALFSVASIRLTGWFLPPLMNPGTVFFEGNSPLASGAVVEYPPLVMELADESPSGESDFNHVVYRLLPRSVSVTPLSQAETNRIWASRAVHFIVDEPIHYLGRLTRKLYYVFHAFQWHDLPAPHIAESLLRKRYVPCVPLSLVSALALCGLLVGLSRWRAYALYYLFFFNQVAVMLVTYASARQRLALIPFLIIFAVVGLDWFIRSRPVRPLPVLALALLAVLFSVDSDQMRSKWSLWENYVRHKRMKTETYRLRDDGRFPEAAVRLAQCYAAVPWLGQMGIRPAGLPLPAGGLAEMALREFSTVRGDDPDAGLDRAVLLIEAGDLDGAERILKQLRRQGRRSYRCVNRPVQPDYYLGRIAALRGRRAEAVESLKAALLQAPGDPDVLAQLAALTDDQQFSARLYRYFGESNALRSLAWAYFENGQPARAAALLRRLLDRLPRYWKGEVTLAAALADSGQDEQAIASYLSAMRKFTEPVLWADKILPSFRRRALSSAADDSAWFWYAVALRQSGRYLESRDILRKSLAHDDNREIRKTLADVEWNIRRSGLSEKGRRRP